MSDLPREILAAIALGPVLWWVGAVGFDAVHWALHRMLRSRWRLLRALAWPHAVHHQWIDRALVTHLERRRANVWCHIVPEYGTQLVYTAGLALLLPLPFAVVVGVLQTGVFAFILSQRGQDVNHRPLPRIDAPPPGWGTPPAYHVLHHVWPDAYFSAYTKLWDWLVGGAAAIAQRRFAWRGDGGALGRALRHEVERAGGRSPDAASPADSDVLVLLDPDEPLRRAVEGVIEATRRRQLAPEVWALRQRADDALARHYRDDPRVCFRLIQLPPGDPDPRAARRLARRALFWIRRDARFVPLAGWAGLRRFRATAPRAPEGVAQVRHR